MDISLVKPILAEERTSCKEAFYADPNLMLKSGQVLIGPLQFLWNFVLIHGILSTEKPPFSTPYNSSPISTPPPQTMLTAHIIFRLATTDTFANPPVQAIELKQITGVSLDPPVTLDLLNQHDPPLH